MGKPLRVLIVEDSEADACIMLHQLKTGGYEPEHERVETAEAMRTALREKTWDVILCDYRLPQFDGRAAIALLKETGLDTPIIIVSGAIGEETAVAAMKAGAHDYIMKDNPVRLVPAIVREIQDARTRSHRREIEKQFGESEKRFYHLFQNAPVPMAIGTLEEGRFMDVNEQFLRFMGFSLGEIIGHTVAELNLWTDLEDRKKVIDAILQNRGSISGHPVSIRTKSGKIRDVLFSADIISFNDVPCLLSSTIDITERKRAEELIRNAERQWQTTFDAMNDAVCLLDMEGRILRCNRAMSTLTGRPTGELAGVTCYSVIHGTTEPPPDCPIHRMIQSRCSEELVLPFGDRWLEVKVDPLFDAGGRISGAVHIIEDITERKRNEIKLQESERRFMDVLYASDDAILLIGDNKFVDCNEATARMLKYATREEFLQVHPSELSPPEQPDGRSSFEKADEMMRLAFDQGYNRFEWMHRRANGEDFPVEVSLTPIVHEGKRLLYCVWRDITERKRAERALRQAEEQYRSIFEGAQEGIYRTTPEGRVIMANPAMARIFGYESPHEMMTAIKDAARQLYVKPEDRAETLNSVEEKGFVAGLEAPFYRKDGTITWCSRSIRAIRDDKGKTLYYEGIIEDITERRQNTERLRKALRGTVQAVAVMVETRDPYTAGHQRRVSDLARTIATGMNLSHDQIDGLRTAGTIHDIGKISIPAEILSMPRRLTPIEFSLIKTHAQSGYDILKDIEFPWPIARMILEHHERVDGSGYPNGLTGDKLLMESKILTVADVVEAIASHRPYRAALGIGVALEEITKNKGIHYDPDVVDACLHIFNEKGYKIVD
jgi:PAS domain S-box-containing protein